MVLSSAARLTFQQVTDPLVASLAIRMPEPLRPERPAEGSMSEAVTPDAEKM